MKRKTFTHSLINSFTCLLLPSVAAFGQTDSINQVLDLESVTIQAIRASEKTPVSFSTMNKTEIERLNNVSNIPVLLQLMPSVVATTENGTAMGNTSFRIRGVDASRINVTLNGLPLNDPESQAVFWVNLPNLAGFLNSVQVQRGIGTSSNGSAAFGASVNLETNKISPKPYIDISGTTGSFNTFGANISANSGLLKNGLFFEGTYSKINSNGYIHNSAIDHESAYFSAGLVKNNHFLKANYLYGEQKTGIAWGGAQPDSIIKYGKRHNPDGIKGFDSEGNPIYYDNETDNYRSHIFQMYYVFDISRHWTFNTGFNYTNGFGFTDTYRRNLRFNRVGLPNLPDGRRESDIIRLKYMRNDFYATNANLQYSKNNLNVNIGGHYSRYIGDYYGELKWIKLYEELGMEIPDNHEWYEHQGIKTEASLYTKFDYTVSQNFNVFWDLQYRRVNHSIQGTDDDNNLSKLDFSERYHFFNPKFGWSFFPDANQRWYASVAMASREPSRADIKEFFRNGRVGTIVKPERMLNYELGYQIQKERWAFGANFYFMDYTDQLVPTGRITQSGVRLMENIAESFRTGIEVVGGYQINKQLRLDANLTLSQNKIRNHVEIRHTYENSGNWRLAKIDTIFHKSTDLAYSPNVVGAGILTYSPIERLNIMLTGKYVGKQFYDNFSTKQNRLDAYFVSDFSVYYEFPMKREHRKIYVQGIVNNLFNKDYMLNAWVDGNSFLNEPSLKGFFVQAPIHFSIKLGVRL